MYPNSKTLMKVLKIKTKLNTCFFQGKKVIKRHKCLLGIQLLVDRIMLSSKSKNS
jgi:hypothetical protein